jgi:hypothetical protein
MSLSVYDSRVPNVDQHDLAQTAAGPRNSVSGCGTAATSAFTGSSGDPAHGRSGAAHRRGDEVGGPARQGFGEHQRAATGAAA